MKDAWGVLIIALAIIGLGLVLRFGNTSVPLVQTGAASAKTALNALTLKGYQDFGPGTP